MRVTFRRFPDQGRAYSLIEREDGVIYRMLEFTRPGPELPLTRAKLPIVPVTEPGADPADVAAVPPPEARAADDPIASGDD